MNLLHQTHRLLEKKIAAPGQKFENECLDYQRVMDQVTQELEKPGVGLEKKILGWVAMIVGGLIFLAAALALTTFLVTTFSVSLPTVMVGGGLLASLSSVTSSVIAAAASVVSSIGVGSSIGISVVGAGTFVGGFFLNKKGSHEWKMPQWKSMLESMQTIQQVVNPRG